MYAPGVVIECAAQDAGAVLEMISYWASTGSRLPDRIGLRRLSLETVNVFVVRDGYGCEQAFALAGRLSAGKVLNIAVDVLRSALDCRGGEVPARLVGRGAAA